MVISEGDIRFVQQLLDACAAHAPERCVSVASKGNDDAGVPRQMQAGPVDAHGWVKWKVLPSTLKASDVAAVEKEFGVEFPSLFRAYLVARFHLFDQIGSRKHDQQILMTDVPSSRPMGPLRELLDAFEQLIGADYLPFAEWGDGWGPLCFDLRDMRDDGDRGIVWFDHEVLADLEPDELKDRRKVQKCAQPIYTSFREFLLDTFGAV